MKHNRKDQAEASMQPAELKACMWSEIWLCANKAKNKTKWVAYLDDHKVALTHRRWVMFNRKIDDIIKMPTSAISRTYFSRNSCRPCRRWSTWCGLFILKKGVLDGSSGNCLYKQQANTQLKPKPKQRRKMLQENANPKHLKFMSHVPEAQETEFENAQLRKWGASDTTWKEK